MVDYKGSFLDVPLTPIGPSFVDYVLSIVNVDRAVRFNFEGMIELLCPLASLPAPKLKVHFQGSRRVFTPPPPHSRMPSKAWKAKAKAQPSMPTLATEEDTRPKVLILREWRKVPDAFPKDACGQLERDQQFINELAKLLVAESHMAC